MKLRGGELRYQAFIYGVVSLLLLISAFPLTYVVCVSLTSEQEWLRRGNLMIFPHRPTLEAYSRVFTATGLIVNSFLVSAVRTALGTLLGLAFTLIPGYAISRRDLPGRRVLQILILITVLFGGGMIPSFPAVKDTGLYNTLWALIIPGLTYSWGCLVCKQFFVSLPAEIEEAAQVDGVSKTGLFFRIALPASLPLISSIGLFIAVDHWNAWFDAMLYITDDRKKPLQFILYSMNVNPNLGYELNRGSGTAPKSAGRALRMALTVIGTVPVLCVYPFFQKYFVKGVYMGSVKG